MEKLVMEINDYNSIEKAEIEINKINVIGGVNGSGKSTASKILYSFLKGNSIKRREYALQHVAEHINDVIDNLDYDDNDYNLPEHLNIDDDEGTFIEKYNSMLEISKKHDELAKSKVKELGDEISKFIDETSQRLIERGISLDGLDLTEDISDNSLNFEFFLSQLDSPDFTDEMYIIGKLHDEYSYFDFFSDTHFSCSLYNGIMNYMFFEDSYKLSRFSEACIQGKEYIGNLDSDNADFYMKSSDTKYDPYSYFFNTDFVNSVYYVDNVSVLDLLALDDFSSKQLFHMTEIIEDLFEVDEDIELEDDVKIILDKIEKIIKGKYKNNRPIFESNKIVKNDFRKYGNLDDLEENSFLRKLYEQKSRVNTYNFNTPSGIKQIGVIQLLLLNNKLKKGGYLIIDEPEVNLHPEWQIKFAEILVLIAKELNITLYLNSHSPMFIEAMSLYAQYYDLIEGTNVYLTQEVADDKYIFKKIDSKNMGEVYENLTKPYDELDKLKAKILFKE